MRKLMPHLSRTALARGVSSALATSVSFPAGASVESFDFDFVDVAALRFAALAALPPPPPPGLDPALSDDERATATAAGQIAETEQRCATE